MTTPSPTTPSPYEPPVPTLPAPDAPIQPTARKVAVSILRAYENTQPTTDTDRILLGILAAVIATYQ